jgi:ATP-dependent RNA helicase SUPV3L1/SUV3
VEALARALSQEDRRALARLGVRLGTETVWLPALAAKPAVQLLRLLAAVETGCGTAVTPVPARRPASLAADPAVPELLYGVAGYRLVAGRAVRADALERLARAARHLARQGPFAATEALRLLIDGPIAALPELLLALGYVRQRDGAEDSFTARPRDGASKRRRSKPRPRADTDSPFAALGVLRRRG